MAYVQVWDPNAKGKGKGKGGKGKDNFKPGKSDYACRICVAEWQDDHSGRTEDQIGDLHLTAVWKRLCVPGHADECKKNHEKKFNHLCNWTDLPATLRRKEKRVAEGSKDKPKATNSEDDQILNLQAQVKKNVENNRQRMEAIKSRVVANPSGNIIDEIEALCLDIEEAFHDCDIGEATEEDP